MFIRTINSKPLRAYTSHAPEMREDDLFGAFLTLPPATSIQTYLTVFRNTPDMTRIIDAIAEDLIEMRDKGNLGPHVQAPGRQIDYLEKWNEFLDGVDDRQTLKELAAPVVRMIESDVIRLFNAGKYRAGPINGHDRASVDMDVARRRLLDIEADLNASLAFGTSHLRHAGSLNAHDKTGLIRIKLVNFMPLVEHARMPSEGHEARVWHPVALTERDVEVTEPDTPSP